MPDNTTTEEMKDLQARIVRRMEEFSVENPAIAEALAVMNMTMPEYVQAIDAIHGGQVFPASAYIALPLPTSF
jgi:hypothetical protein